MLVSHIHRFIFIKPYKVGGTSVEMFLQPACQPSGQPVTHGTGMLVSPVGIVGARADFTATEPPEFYNHMTARQIRDALPTAIWAGYRKISVVRNPFARYLSGYFMHARKVGADPALATVRADLADYITQVRDWGDRDYLRIAGQPVVEDVLRFERLAADADRIAQSLSFTPPAPLRHAKKASDLRVVTPLPDFYTPAAIAAVMARDGWYFDHFAYSRDPAEAASLAEAAQ